MALTVAWGPIGVFDPYTRDQASYFRKLALAVLGGGTNAERETARTELLQRPDFRAQANTTDNSAASQVIDLTDKGVTFPASTIRKIRFRSIARSDNDQWFQEWEQYVLGGTTPLLLGSARLLNACGNINGTVVQYGNCHAAVNFDSSDTAITTAVGTSNVASSSTAGSSIGNISTNTAVLTHPVARASGIRILGINASSDVATATESLLATVFPGASATTMSIYTADTATPTGDGFDDDGRLEVSFYILPPPSVALVMNSNNVEIHAGHDASDVLDHYIDVFVGKAEQSAFSPV